MKAQACQTAPLVMLLMLLAYVYQANAVNFPGTSDPQKGHRCQHVAGWPTMQSAIAMHDICLDAF